MLSRLVGAPETLLTEFIERTTILVHQGAEAGHAARPVSIVSNDTFCFFITLHGLPRAPSWLIFSATTGRPSV